MKLLHKLQPFLKSSTIIAYLFFFVLYPVAPILPDLLALETSENEVVSYPEVLEETQEVLETEVVSYPEVLEETPVVEEIIEEISSETIVEGLHTFNNISIGTEYVYSLNSEVKIQFTNLPEGSNYVSIKEVEVTVDESTVTGYEFTSNMVNGTFEYSMTLPNPYGEVAEVKFSEDSETFQDLSSVATVSTVTFTGDHFTVFVVVNPSIAPDGTACTNASVSGICYDTIQEAINAADLNPGADTIRLFNGVSYNECLSISDSDLSIIGQSRANTIINTSACPAYGINIAAGSSNITFSQFTVEGPNTGANGNYGIKVEGSTGININNVIVQNSRRSNIDFNGVNNVSINNVAILNAQIGNGIAFTDSNNVTIGNIRSQNNAWSSIAIYSCGKYYPAGASNYNFTAKVEMDGNLGLNIEEDTGSSCSHTGTTGLINNINFAAGSFFYDSSTPVLILLQAATNIDAHLANFASNPALTDWAVVESRIYHDCDNSPYFTEACNGNNSNLPTVGNSSVAGNDFSAAYGSVNYRVIPAPVVDINELTARIISGTACGIGSAWSDDGLEVNITNWNASYQLQGRYFTNGGGFNSWFDLSTWGAINVSGDDASFFVPNAGNSTPGAAGWEVRVVDTSDLNTAISNVDSLNYTIVTDPNTFVCDGNPQNLRWEAQSVPLTCGATTSSYTVSAVWDAFDGATQYEYSVTTPGLPVWTTTVNGTTYAGAFNQGSGDYSFRVRAVSPMTSEWSAECSVTFDPVIDVPILLSPADNAVVNTNVLVFDWSDVASLNGPVTYQFQSSFGATTGGPVNAFTSIVYTSAPLAGSQVASPGNADMVAYWQARACDTVVCSTWSNPWSVNIDNTLPVITVNNSVEAGPVKTDTINVTASDTHLDASTLGFAFSADTTCDVTDVYSTSFSSAVDYVINTEANNGTYLCARAADLAGNTSYALVGTEDINIDNTAPVVTIVSPVQNALVSGIINVEANATDANGMGYFAIRLHQTVANGGAYIQFLCPQQAPGANLLGTNYTQTCTFDTAAVADGTYKVEVWALDSAINWGTAGVSSEYQITIDNTAPSIPVNGTPDNVAIPTNNFDFEWDDSTDASAITYVFQSSLNPAQVGGVLTTNLWTSGTLPTSMIHSSGAPDGTWYWQVRAIDAAGNMSAWSEIWDVTLDTVAPTGTISYSITTLTNGDVTATLSTSEPVTITNNGGLNTYVFTANGTFTFEFSDAAGNTGTAVATVTNIDKTNPVIPGNPGWATNTPMASYMGDGSGLSNFVACTQYITSSTPRFGVWGEATDASGILRYERDLRYNGSYVGTYNSVTNYTGSFTPILGTSANGGQGTYAVRVRAVDNAGNKSIDDVTWSNKSIDGTWCTMTIDLTTPVTTLNAYTPDPTLINTPTYTGIAVDNLVNITNVEYRYSNDVGVTWSAWENTTASDGAFDSLSENFTFTTSALVDGDYIFQVRATDAAGNVETIVDDASQDTVIIDTLPPVLDAAPYTMNEGETAIVIADLFSNPESLTLVCTPSTLVASDFEVTQPDTEKVTTVECTIEDLAGNSTTTTSTLTVNNVAPSVTIDASPSTSVVSGTPVTLTADVSGNVLAGNTIASYAWAGDCSGTGASTVLNTPTATSYNCSVTVTDVDGDTATANITVSASNGIPSVVIIATPGVNVTSGTTVTLQGNVLGGDASFSYVWSSACSGNGTNAGGLTNTTTVPSVPGSYYCRIDVTDANGDTASAGVIVAVNAPTTNGVGNGGQIAGVNTTDEESEETEEETPASFPTGSVLGATSQVCDSKETLSGNVYQALNSNSVRDENETGISNVEVIVYGYDENGVKYEAGRTTTNTNGDWELDVCPGEYDVEVNSSTIPAGKSLRSGSVLGASSDSGDVNFEIVDNGFNFFGLFAIIALILLIVGGIVWFVRNRQEQQLN